MIISKNLHQARKNMQPDDLSKLDLSILRELQRDASQGQKELAERLGASPSTIWRRVNDLEAAELISGKVALLNAERVGFPVCVFVFVDLLRHEQSIRAAFERFVQETPQIMECFSVTGAHDYTMIVRTRTVAEFEHLLMEKILGHPSVRAATSQIALRQQKYSTALPI
ncbi:MAG: Lrp/AsnC family transcriptional regulator [Hyphomonadaceae bacterium]